MKPSKLYEALHALIGERVACYAAARRQNPLKARAHDIFARMSAYMEAPTAA